MHGDIVWFVFYLVGHMLKYCGAEDLPEAVKMATCSINEVLGIHNSAVLAVQRGDRASYYIPYSAKYLSDNQCVLSGMLKQDTIYKRIDTRVLHTMGIDVPIISN